MYRLKERKTLFLQSLCILLLAAILTGCGKRPVNEEGKADSVSDGYEDTAADVTKETDKDTNQGVEKDTQEQPNQGIGEQGEALEMPELSEEEVAALQYIEKMALEDYYGDKSEYDAYVLKGGSTTNGLVYSRDHGLTYTASAWNMGSASLMYEFLESSVDSTVRYWQDKESGYTDVEIGEVMENGDDRYQMVQAKKEDLHGVFFGVKHFYYLDMQGEGVGVLWSVELKETDTDDETDLIIDELAKCYRVNLNALKIGDEWLAADKGYADRQQDVYEPRKGDNVLKKVDGYQYMGLTTLTTYDNKIECPIMVPMGWSTNIQNQSVKSSLHGVALSGSISKLKEGSLKEEAKSSSKMWYDYCVRKEESYRNIQKSEMMPISGYDEALEVVITYEEKDFVTKEYAPCVKAMCYIRINEDYALNCEITLFYDEYDNSTNTVIKELETAYGIDLSEYYNE